MTLAASAGAFVFVIGILEPTDRSDRAASYVAAAAGLGLALGVKVSNLAFIIPPIALCGWRLFTERWTWRRKVAVMALSIAALSISVPFYAKAWFDTGSPSYPIPVEIAGTTWFAGSEWQRLIFSLPLRPPSDDTLPNLLSELLLPRSGTVREVGQFMNLGPSALLLIVAMITALPLVARSSRRISALLLLVCAALVVASALPESAVNLRTFFGWSLGRFLLVPIACIAILAALSRSAWTHLLLLGAALINVGLAMPLGWSRTDVIALTGAWPSVVAMIAVVPVSWFLIRRGKNFFAVGAVALLAATALSASTASRERLRYNYFQDLAEGRAWSVNKDAAALAMFWPLWKAVDTGEPLRLAIAGDWGSMSPLGPRFPFLGDHLQNAVDYVPVSTSGHVIDRPDYYANAESGDFDAWMRRLTERRIQRLVVLSPTSIEGRWATQHPEIFSPVEIVPRSPGLLFKINATVSQH